VDILGDIKRDHNNVKALFREFEGLGVNAKATRLKLARKIMEELVAHDEAEEQTLYGRLKERVRESDARIKLFEAYTEHTMASDLISKLQKSESVDEEFTAMFQVLRENVEHHIKEEEGNVHKIAKDVFDKEELEELAPQFEEAKKRVTAKR